MILEVEDHTFYGETQALYGVSLSVAAARCWRC